MWLQQKGSAAHFDGTFLLSRQFTDRWTGRELMNRTMEAAVRNRSEKDLVMRAVISILESPNKSLQSK